MLHPHKKGLFRVLIYSAKIAVFDTFLLPADFLQFPCLVSVTSHLYLFVYLVSMACTAELLRQNDDLNNVILRYERYRLGQRNSDAADSPATASISSPSRDKVSHVQRTDYAFMLGR